MNEPLQDAWRWWVVPWSSPRCENVILEGECETYEAAQAAMMLLGVHTRPYKSDIKRFFVGPQMVYIMYERVRDGYKMEEWGIEVTAMIRFPVSDFLGESIPGE
jgi:hypothetical protein